MLGNSSLRQQAEGSKNRGSLGGGLSKTQTFKPSKVAGGVSYSISNTANALAMILHQESQMDQEALGKRLTSQQAVTPERKAMNAMVHARNLSSQQNSQSWVLNKSKGIANPPTNNGAISARP